jgi:flagellar P-ring protein precursor FlgI
MKKTILLTVAALMGAPAWGWAAQDGIRVKDLVRIDGWRDNQLVGYGIVTGLAGTGDSLRSRATQQSIANMLGQFGVNVSVDQVQSRNVAAVMVTATLPPFARPGDKLDIVVTSLGDARSLLGGALLLTPLKGADDRVRALAQGPVSVGGYKYDLNGNLVQKNHPTVGAVPSGANVELGIAPPQVVRNGDTMALVMAVPDYTTAGRIASAVNTTLGRSAARAADASRVVVTLQEDDQRDLVGFIAKIENATVEPDQRARVVVNERTGTVVSGGDVRISKVTISHSDLKVSITTDYLVSQPLLVRQAGRGVRTEVVPTTRIEVGESEASNVTLAANNTVTDLVNALSRIKTSTRDVISILQGIKAAGALHAELIIQ